ncbi:unnamed protein product [Tenebrio molitor]|nr:unnamed protein product [Tenebrio molitor]
MLLKKCKPGHQMVICSLFRSQMMKLTVQSKVRLLKIPTVRSKAYINLPSNMARANCMHWEDFSFSFNIQTRCRLAIFDRRRSNGRSFN